MKNTQNILKNTLLIGSMTALISCSDNSSPVNPETSPEPVTPSAKTTTPAVETDSSSVNNTAETSNDGIAKPLEFTLTNLKGEQVKAADYRGKWLVLNYWATWCAPCRDEMPELVKFQSENADNVQVLGIAFEDATVEKLQNFANDFNINYPLLTLDVYNPPEFAAEGGLGLPTTIVYNPEGLRHKKHMGPIDAAGLLEMVQ